MAARATGPPVSAPTRANIVGASRDRFNSVSGATGNGVGPKSQPPPLMQNYRPAEDDW